MVYPRPHHVIQEMENIQKSSMIAPQRLFLNQPVPAVSGHANSNSDDPQGEPRKVDNV